MAEASFFEKIEKIKMPIRILILLGTIGLLGGAFFFLVYHPKTLTIADVRQEISDIDRKITRAKLKTRRLAQLEQELKSVDALFKEALKLLPNAKEIPALLRNITQLGSDSNLEFRLFSPQRENAHAFYYQLPVSVEVSGTYHDVAIFFDKVGRMERIVNILDVTMNPVKSGSSRLITKCSAVTYRFKGKTDVKGQRTGG